MTADDRQIRDTQHEQILSHLHADRVTATNTEASVARSVALLEEIRDLLAAQAPKAGA